MEELTKQEQNFVKEVAITDNKTQAVVKAYKVKDPDYAGVKGHRLIRKDKIKKAVAEVKKTIADQIPDELLVKTHLEGLKAGKHIYKNNNESGEIEDLGVEADYATRHKYLESGYKVKGTFAPDKNINLNVNLDDGLTEEEKIALLALIGK